MTLNNPAIFILTLFPEHFKSETLYRSLLAIILLIYFNIGSLAVAAQELPKEGISLNYRIIGFKFDKPKTSTCSLMVAAGSHFSDDSFNKKVIITRPAKTNKIIAEVPSFGKDYTWRIIYKDLHGKITSSPLHHFSTQYYEGVDTALHRLRIIDKATKYKDAYVFIEANRAIYDMNGHPVWFLPQIEDVIIKYVMPFDLQLSPRHTATFLYEQYAGYEVDYNGKILFRTPRAGLKINGDTTEYLHEEFRMLKNGHFMTMGTQVGLWDHGFTARPDSSSLYFPGDGKQYVDKGQFLGVGFGTLIEYDRGGNVVWSWKSSNYFRNTDVYFHKRKRDFIDPSPHQNSFYLDEKNKYIYLGYRDISRILKLKYPEGVVTQSYGETFTQMGAEKGNGLFCRQTSCKVAANGDLYLFNNNACDNSEFPKVVMFSPVPNKDGSMKKTWEFTCPIEGEPGPTQSRYQFTFGGNVVELPDRSFFVSMSTLYCRVLIVSREKKILWSALPEHWNKERKEWELGFQYKASLINTRVDLEKFVWSQE